MAEAAGRLESEFLSIRVSMVVGSTKLVFLASSFDEQVPPL